MYLRGPLAKSVPQAGIRMEVPCATLVARGALSGLAVGDALGTDTSFHELMSMNPDVWHDIKTGRMTLHSDVSFTRTADPEKIRFTTTPITLAPHHMDNIDAKVAARTDATGRGDTPWIRHG